MIIDGRPRRPAGLEPRIERLFAAASEKTLALGRRWKAADGAPVFTAAGRYTSRGWTEWTQGFQFGSALYCYEATGRRELLDYARAGVRGRMAVHLSHTGVHDHGFNNVSTYGNLLRLARRGLIEKNDWELEYYELALKVSGAVQAARWTELPGRLGYVYSFNGPHSLFVDTMRTLRSLALAWRLGHPLMGERDRRIDLLERLLAHAETTARFAVWFGTGRDAYDLRGRTAHEAVFNLNDGSFRCPSSQQGWSPFTTWTRGLAWIMLGYAEELEFLDTVSDAAVASFSLPYYPDRAAALARFEETARAAADFYLDNTAADGIPYWDSGAPGLSALGDWRGRPAEPDNDHEPVDSSAAAIAAQGLLRLGRRLERRGAAGDAPAAGARYFQAGLALTERLLEAPYFSNDAAHEGLLLNSIYHRPNGWDYLPPGSRIPRGEACLWGDYHLLELGMYTRRLAEGGDLRFFDCLEEGKPC